MKSRGRSHNPGLLCIASQTLNRMARRKVVSRIDHNIHISEQLSIGFGIVTKAPDSASDFDF